MSLTANQKRFVEEYVIDRNGTAAYFRAFGRRTSKGKLRSYRTARSESSKLLTNPNIRAEVEAGLAALAKSSRISAKRVLYALASIAFVDIADYFDDGPEGLIQPRPIAEIPPRARRALASVKVKRRRENVDGSEWIVEEVEYKLSPRGPALDALAKHLGLFSGGSAIQNLLTAIEQAVALSQK